MTALTERFAEAVRYAAIFHATQVRKGTDVPYIGHLLGVASLVLDAGGVRLPVRAENVRRGYVSIKVELPSGQVAEVRAPEATGLDAVGVRLDPDAVAVVRDADPTAR